MTKEKTSVTLDRDKVNAVRRITGAASTSAAIDIALSETIALARIRQDVLAYQIAPPNDDQVALAGISHDWSDLADGTDWDALYEDAGE